MERCSVDSDFQFGQVETQAWQQHYRLTAGEIVAQAKDVLEKQ